MTDTVRIYHNPRCSKSRQTLALIEENGIQPEIIRYLDTPPNADELRAIIDALGVSVRDIIRVKESEYKEQGLDDPSLSDDQIIRILTEHPRLIERPIVVKGNKAAIGRPPESVLPLL